MAAATSVRGRGARAKDLAVAGGCWLVVAAVLLAVPLLQASDPATVIVAPRAGSGPWWVLLATLTVQAALLVRGRSHPRSALLGVAALTVPLALAGTGDVFSLTSAAVTVAVFLAVTVRPLRTLALTLVGAAALLVLGEVVNGVGGGSAVAPALVGGLLQAVGAVGLPLLLGVAVAGRRDARDARRDEARAANREQDALVRAAVADERTAMARELHDIAAHHLSGIALMAAAIDRQIDTDPETAKRSVRAVRAESTAVLEDLRRLVGLLRTDTDADRGVSTLVGVRELVEHRRAAGAAVELRTLVADGAGLGDRVGPIAQLALHRIAQEALANAATHAPGAAVVVEIDDRDPWEVTLTVTNGRGHHVPTSRRGFGLVGMQERADLVGAALRCGPTPDGGWEVRVVIGKDATGPGARGAVPEQVTT
ncbi:MAG TPA: histidine kinase [Friedmanniella sp.]